MTIPTLVRLLSRGCALAGLFLASAAFAQSAGTGTVEGRVLNANNGSYLTNARVSVDGTTVQAFTDRNGGFRLTDVPAGEAKITVFYTGLVPQTATVPVQAGQVSTRDFDLSSSAAAPKAGDVVKLDAYMVASKREMDSAAIAINEQRFSGNIKSVVATDALGDITEGNVGDFAKFLPGVNVDYVATDARTISLRGVAANYTSVTVDGVKLASANSSNPNRTFELEQVSLNNTARIEIFKSRTPDISADALGGAVNLIPRSAFERSRPSLSYRAFVALNGAAEKTLSKSRGPTNRPSHKLKGGFDFVYIRPVTKDFGFTLSLLESNTYNPQDLTQPLWAPTNQARVAATVEHPYLSNYTVRPGPKNNQRESIGTTMDWRFAPNDVLSVAAQWNFYNASFSNRGLAYDVGNAVPTNIDANGFVPREAVHGAPGAGSVLLGGTSFRHKYGTTYSTDLKWRHTGPIWKLDAGLSFSHASNHYHDQQDDHFENVQVRLRGNPATTAINGATVWFDEIDRMDYLLPGKITVFDSTGTQPLDLANPANYNIVQAGFNPADSSDVFKTARVNARREFNLRVPFALKTGALLQEQTRDIRKDNRGAWNFVGPDGQPNTADDNLSRYDVTDPQYASELFGFGTPRVPYPDPYRLYSLFQSNPSWWRIQDPANVIRNTANESRWFRETILAAYLMADTRLVDNRLRLTGGIRFERTKDEGHGVLNNAAAARGITDPVAAAQAQFQVRGLRRTITYDGWYPSLDASFEIRPNLLARAAYAKSIGRQDLANIIPGATLPDASSGSGAITITNSSLDPTMTDSFDLSLEYYFTRTGVLSVGVFKKDFKDFSGTLPATQVTPALLAELGVPNPTDFLSGSFTITSRVNVGEAKLTGVEFNYSQVLDAEWLPAWTRNFTVFANGQKLHLEGSTLADFSNFIRETYNWGVKYGIRKFSAQVNVNHRGRQRLAAQAITNTPVVRNATNTGWVAGTTSAAPGVFEYFKPRAYIDGNLEYRWRDHVGFFVNVRNLTNIGQDSQRYGPGTPAWARTRAREIFGAQYTLGVKGEF